MPRRKRIHIPGFLWHITHRCHKKEHLLKFEKDRKTWRNWLFKAKKRYGLRVITYVVTCNHIHLLAVDSGKDIRIESENSDKMSMSKHVGVFLSLCKQKDIEIKVPEKYAEDYLRNIFLKNIGM